MNKMLVIKNKKKHIYGKQENNKHHWETKGETFAVSHLIFLLLINIPMVDQQDNDPTKLAQTNLLRSMKLIFA